MQSRRAWSSISCAVLFDYVLSSFREVDCTIAGVNPYKMLISLIGQEGKSIFVFDNDDLVINDMIFSKLSTMGCNESKPGIFDQSPILMIAIISIIVVIIIIVVNTIMCVERCKRRK